MNSFSIKVQGLAELQRALTQLPIEIAKNPLRKAVKKGAQLIQAEAKSIAKGFYKTGTLERNIVVMKTRRPVPGQMEYAVGVRKGKKVPYVDNAYNRRKRRVGKKYASQGEAYYWRYLEFGTKKMNKRAFLVPAFENKKMTAVEAIKRELAIAIEQEVAKLRIRK
jgi:HK97 gp10 family phage protein